MKNFSLFILVVILSGGLNAQCGTWTDSKLKDVLVEQHVFYQRSLEAYEKTKDPATLKDAYENWSKAFAVAPAADGKRAVQYIEGAKLNQYMFAAATTDADKAKYKEIALKVYDQMANCYNEKVLPCDSPECIKQKMGFAYGRKAFDMFYHYNAPYVQTLEAIETAITQGGLDNEYIIFAPAASIVKYNIENGTMDKAKAVELYTKLNEIADHNINNHPTLSAYYTQAKENMNGTFAEVEDKIFDCEYFKEKLQPDYESGSDNPDILKYILATLKSKGCPAEDPFLVEVQGKWSKYAAEYNAKVQAEFEANNPGMMAKKLYDDGKFGEAIAKYDEAIAESNDNEQKAQYLFSKASIQFRKLSQYSTARSTAYEAAKMKPGWGRPYLLIGDMYGKTARSCGDSWNQRLAILAAIEKYAYAKSIDGEVAEEASNRIGSYSGSLPSEETGFMRGVKAGDSQSVGCWIGETVRMRYK